MSTENNNQGATAREIPTPPGGGSWTFDEAKWKWVSNDPVPEAAPEPVAEPVPAAETVTDYPAQEFQ